MNIQTTKGPSNVEKQAKPHSEKACTNPLITINTTSL